MTEVLFNTLGSALTFGTAFIGLVTVMFNLILTRRAKQEITEVKVTANGRTDRLLSENRALREWAVAQGANPDEIINMER